jgi:GH24 family phage-related lysozyme (muramidase)
MINNMKFSQDGIDCLRASEGMKNFIYKDSGGLASIGIGHLIKEGERFTTLTDAECYELLKQDVSVAEADVSRMVKVEPKTSLTRWCALFSILVARISTAARF